MRDNLGPLLTYAPVDGPLKLFRVAPDSSHDFEDELRVQLIRDALDALSPTPDPFARYMEAPGWLIDLSQKSGHQIREAQQVLKMAVSEVMRMILVTQWPGIESRTVSWEILAAEDVHRYPPGPPEWDEW